MKKPATIYTRNSTVSTASYRAAEGFDLEGRPVGRSAYIDRDLNGASLRDGASPVGPVVTESDAIRWVALGVLPDGVELGLKRSRYAKGGEG